LSRRVVVTGVGLLTPLGLGTEVSWEAIRAGKSGVGPITQFDASAFSCRIAGEVKGFDPASYIEKKEIKKMGRFIQFAIPAAEWALKNSELQITRRTPNEWASTSAAGSAGSRSWSVSTRRCSSTAPAAFPRSSFRP